MFQALQHVFQALQYKIYHDRNKKIQARPCGRACTLYIINIDY